MLPPRGAGEEAVFLVPVTDDGFVVALDADDRLTFGLTIAALRELFRDEGLTLWLFDPSSDHDDDDGASLSAREEAAFSELEQSFDAPGDEVVAAAGVDDVDVPDTELVRVSEFSHRGPVAARVTAQLLRTDVTYRTRGTWSLLRYRTGESFPGFAGNTFDDVVIVLNAPAHGDAWIEIVDVAGRTAWFWPNAERDTEPVLDIGSIAVPEIADLYRRMLSEADGSIDELELLDLGTPVDVPAAYRACAPESVGGIPGAERRLREFLAALGLPTELVEVAVTDPIADASADADDPSLRHFAGRGWGALVGDILVGGMGEMLSLSDADTRRGRFVRAVNRWPLVGAGISATELAAGVVLSRSRSRFLRVLGALSVIDAAVDLVIWAIRWRKRRS